MLPWQPFPLKIPVEGQNKAEKNGVRIKSELTATDMKTGCQEKRPATHNIYYTGTERGNDWLYWDRDDD